MPKNNIYFVCKSCGDTFSKWSGQCLSCSAWNSLEEFKLDNSKPQVLQNIIREKPIALNQIRKNGHSNISSGLSEFDKTLGNGFVEGSVILIGGKPGIGKSTLILQIMANLAQDYTALYVSGEESSGQIKNRAQRLGIVSDLLLMSDDNLEHIISYAKKINPKVMVIDSIQTISSIDSTSVAGSISQVHNCASVLTSYAKLTNTILIIIGHVTKDGSIAGPRILEHMVDTVLSFESGAEERYRIVRAVKNRFGSVNEISVFAMLANGLKQVTNPSAIFLTTKKAASGMVITAIFEGSRPLLVELQALVDKTGSYSKRVCVGLEQNRVMLMLAILSKHANIKTYDQDVFINIVGGLKATETASDLAVIFAIYSSIANIIIANNVIIFGEVGLTGEVRPVYNALDRLKEAKKQGFTMAIIAKQNKPKQIIKGLNIVDIDNIVQGIDFINKIKQ